MGFTAFRRCDCKKSGFGLIFRCEWYKAFGSFEHNDVAPTSGGVLASEIMLDGIGKNISKKLLDLKTFSYICTNEI